MKRTQLSTTTNSSSGPRAAVKLVRCAIYTRKSTEDGLEQEFNSLDAQREAGEAFVRSQAGEGWAPVPDRYDDGGYTGGHTDRPGLRRLLADVDAGKIDCVVVYKVDRLSRSLLDFAHLMRAFEERGVSFVSVTQQFNTATSMGRLVLNVLLSFAQFEREIIAERTRDKIAATRRKGKWAGGHPPLGYDLDPKGYRLVVNESEAERVRAIFALYLDSGGLLPAVAELNRRGWTTKNRATRANTRRGGKPFGRSSLHRLLTNVTYAGKVKYKTETHPGEHPALVDLDTFNAVQTALARGGPGFGAPTRGRDPALLKGLIRCGCGSALTPTHTAKGTTRYRYYRCAGAQGRGPGACGAKPVPAGAVEQFVVDRIRAAGRDPELLRDALDRARQREQERVAELDAEGKGLARDLNRARGEVHRLSLELEPGADNAALVARLADLHERIGVLDRRAAEVRTQAERAKGRSLDPEEAARALAAFDPVWDALRPDERAEVLALLVERVEYDGRDGRISVTFHPDGPAALVAELNRRTAESDDEPQTIRLRERA